MNQSLAVSGNTSAAMQLASEAPVMSATPTLDRENLLFFANMIESAGLVPVEANTPPAVQKARVMAKIVAGTYYGFDPISSQWNLNVQFNRINLSAQGMHQLLKRTGRYATQVNQLDDNGCKLTVLRKNDNGEWKTIGCVEFTRAMAEKAGLTKRNAVYQSFGADMFFARCITRVVKRFAPEVLDGSPVRYDLAKKDAAPQIASEPQEAITQQLNPAPQPEAPQNYEPQNVEPEPFDDDGVEANFIPVDEQSAEEITADLAESAQRQELIDASNEKLSQLTDVTRKRLLKGRELEQMSIDELEAFYKSLC